MTQVVTQLVIDARGAETGSAAYVRAMKAAQAAADRTIDINEKAQQAQQKGVAVLTGGANSVARVSKEWDRLRGSVDAVTKAQIQAQNAIEAATLKADAAVRKGIASQDEAAAVVARVSAEHTKYVNAAKQAASANENVQGSVKLTGYEMQNLGFQLNDIGTSLGSGSSLFQVMAQQGGQVYQVLAGSSGGVVGAVKDLGARMLGLVTVSRLVLGSVVGIGAAAALSFGSFVDGQRQLEDSLQGLGRTTKASVDDLEKLTNVSAAAARISVGASRDITAAFASTGKISTDVYTGLTVAVRNYADLTKSDLASVAAEFATAFADPAKGAVDLDKKLNILSDETAQYIRRLADTNQKSEAQRVLLKALSDNLPDATRRVTALGYAWQGVSNFASGAYAAMGKAIGSVVNGPTLDEQLAAQRKLVEDLRRGAAGPSGRGRGASSANLPAEEAKLGTLEAQAQKAAKQRQDADDRAAGKAAGDIARARNPQIDQLSSLTRQKSAMTAALNKPGADTDLLMQALNGVDNQIAAITDADGRLLSVATQLRQERELELKVIQAQTPMEKANAQAALDAFKAKKEGSTDAEAAAKAQNGLLIQQAEIYSQLTAAERQRITAAEEAKAAQQLEIDLIGKTAGEAALLKANYQSYWDLRRESDQTGTAFDEAQYERLKKINAETARSVDLAASAKLRNDLEFERAQIGRTPDDQTVASTLRGAGLPVDLNSFDAGLIRTNQVLTDLKSTSKDVFGGIISDIRSGASATDILGNALTRLESKITDMALESITAGLFGKGGGLGSIIGGLFGGGGTPFGMGGIGAKAAGGQIVGPGTGTSDSILARVSNGEYVVNAAATRRHKPVLDAINGGKMPVFAAGGYVGSAPANSNGSSGPQINIYGAPAETRTEMSEDGQRVDIYLEKQVARTLSRTGSEPQRVLRSQYGANVRTARR